MSLVSMFRQDPGIVLGRPFVIELPTDTVAPFTVELYNFDRAWFVANSHDPDLLQDGAKPFATATVPS